MPRDHLPYSDLVPADWREYPEVLTDTLWNFSSADRRDGLHTGDFHGWCIPQVFQQLYHRWTRAGDIVLDLFAGSGTAGIEALCMGRKYVGLDINKEEIISLHARLGEYFPDNTDNYHLLWTNSASRVPGDLARIWEAIRDLGAVRSHFAVMHPPYFDILKFTDEPDDLSNAVDLIEFLALFHQAGLTAFQGLDAGRHVALIIGDYWRDGEVVPLGFRCLHQMQLIGFTPKGIVVKNIAGNERGKGRDSNLWRYRAMAGGFYIFKHEYVMIFQKPPQPDERSRP